MHHDEAATGRRLGQTAEARTDFSRGPWASGRRTSPWRRRSCVPCGQWGHGVDGFHIGPLRAAHDGRRRHLVVDVARVVGHLQARIEHRVEAPQHAHEIGLAAQQQLRAHEFRIELGQWEPGRHHRVLDVVKAIVEAREAAGLALPAFRAGIRRVHTDIDDLRNLEAPLAYLANGRAPRESAHVRALVPRVRARRSGACRPQKLPNSEPSTITTASAMIALTMLTTTRSR